MSVPRDQHDKLIEDGMAQWYALRDERDKLQAMCANWERVNTMLQSENEMLKQRVTALESEKGFYQRFSSELSASVADIGRLCEGVLVKSRQGAYRPNGAAPQLRSGQRDDTVDDGEEVPKFLTQHADQSNDGLEEDVRAQVKHHSQRVRGFDD